MGLNLELLSPYEKFMTSILIFFATTFVVLVAALFFLQDQFIFPAPRIDDRVKLPEGFESVSIATPDGETLAAYYHAPGDGQPTNR